MNTPLKTVRDFARLKNFGEKIAMLTCYDYASAKILQTSAIDCLLVGDSVAMTVHGYPSTLHATIEMMEAHTAAVARGASGKFIVADMPFLSYRKSREDTLENAGRLMKAGASAVKLEGLCEWIPALVESGIPVMGHLGLLPQSVHVQGGYHVQGKDVESGAALLDQAKQLEAAGAFALVLECVPLTLAARITKALAISTIGIGAGAHTDGQVLVWQDMLGFDPDYSTRFLRRYMDGHALIQSAVNRYAEDVKTGAFPSENESYAA